MSEKYFFFVWADFSTHIKCARHERVSESERAHMRMRDCRERPKRKKEKCENGEEKIPYQPTHKLKK